MNRKILLLSFILSFITISACKPQEVTTVDKLQPRQSALEHKEISTAVNTEDEETKNNYTLDIKGRSNQLTTQAWEKMQNWRSQIVAFSNTQENVYINGPNKKMVSLTFDDGPDYNITPAIIEILDENNVPGNFFFIGREVQNYPEVVKDTYNKGNLVLNHSFNHVELTKLTKEEIQQEMDQAGAAIKSVIGKEPALLRTPYGETNEQVASIAQEEGYSIVLWSIDTLDWSQKEAENIVKNVTDNVRNGDIILMHSDSEKIETAKALPMLINVLKAKSFEIVDLETLLNVKAYQ
jgi:peptidoglycan-N-acetylglucosamine deacetylase